MKVIKVIHTDRFFYELNAISNRPLVLRYSVWGTDTSTKQGITLVVYEGVGTDEGVVTSTSTSTTGKGLYQ